MLAKTLEDNPFFALSEDRSKTFLISCVGHRAERVRPVPLMPHSNDAHTFVISVEEGWLDPHHWRDQLAVSAEKCVACLLRKNESWSRALVSLLQKSEAFVFSFYIGDAGNTSLVDAGTPLGATAVDTQGVLVIYFGSAASWRPCNVLCPHQGPVPHS